MIADGNVVGGKYVADARITESAVALDYLS
jgi:hypothetical protein